MAETIPANFKEKLGPFPIYVWGVLVAGGILAYSYMSRKNASAADTNAGVTSDSSGYPVTTTDPLGSSGGGGGGATSVDTPQETNQSWESKGISLLKEQGIGGIAAQASLEQYLYGVPLTWQQGQYVDRVIAAYGLPPEGTQAPPSIGPQDTGDSGGDPAPTPAPAAHKPAPKHHPAAGWPKHYTTKNGDTLSSIARHFYGHDTAHYRNKIRSANGILAQHKTFKAGRQLTIPRA